MKYFFRHWRRLAERLRQASRVLFLFDVDGTLAPIAPTPSAARVPFLLRQRLENLAKRPRTRVGIISGRELDDARRMVGLPHLIYAGDHGMDVCWDGTHRINSVARNHARTVATLSRRIRDAFGSIPGVLIEKKGFSLSVHYRLVDKRSLGSFKAVLNSVRPIIGANDFFIRPGKKVIEILPARAGDKGTAVKLLKKHFRNPLTVYIGDDATDESVFRELAEDDISVRVGHNRRSQAVYHLNNQREVARFLRKLSEI